MSAQAMRPPTVRTIPRVAAEAAGDARQADVMAKVFAAAGAMALLGPAVGGWKALNLSLTDGFLLL